MARQDIHALVEIIFAPMIRDEYQFCKNLYLPQLSCEAHIRIRADDPTDSVVSVQTGSGPLSAYQADADWISLIKEFNEARGQRPQKIL